MKIELAFSEDKIKIEKYDRHIPSERLVACIDNKQIYVLRADYDIVGIIRYSLFWQIIPFIDLIYIDEKFRNQGLGMQIMEYWENEMRKMEYRYVMTSTQADEDAWRFYEKLGYRKVGEFLPPDQEAQELMYLKKI